MIRADLCCGSLAKTRTFYTVNSLTHLGSSCSLRQCCLSSTLPGTRRCSTSSTGFSAAHQVLGCRSPAEWTRAGSRWMTSWGMRIWWWRWSQKNNEGVILIKGKMGQKVPPDESQSNWLWFHRTNSPGVHSFVFLQVMLQFEPGMNNLRVWEGQSLMSHRSRSIMTFDPWP